jgi:aldehyde:ferredoxin oxidoreductase
MTFCKFSSFAMTKEDYAALYSGLTGVEVPPEDLDEIGERIWTQERYFNQLHGFSRKDDILPRRFFEEPSSHGQIYDEEIFEKMLDEYYRKHGYDPDGKVPEETLKKLEVI